MKPVGSPIKCNMIIPYESGKKNFEKSLEDTNGKFFKCPSIYLFAFLPKTLVQSSLEFRIALKAYIVPRLILTCDKDGFLYSVECDIQ